MSAPHIEIKPPTLGRRIASQRVLLGLNQQDLATRAGLSVMTISEAERDAVEPKLSTITAIAGALGVSLDSLVGDQTAA
jgi:transcriptional regulator with XRE-family HTH domain